LAALGFQVNCEPRECRELQEKVMEESACRSKVSFGSPQRGVFCGLRCLH
jgi:hypothetical protein